MSTVLSSLFFFIIALGVLITFHEFGHYWVARKLGVKVLRFSVGFGKPLWSKRSGPDNTEYMIAAIPLGGYVQMLDEREGEVPTQEQHRAFNRQPLWSRAAIVFAGPFFNFILAVVAFWLVFMFGIPGMKPLLGEVPASSLAARAGLHSGDVILQVGDKQVDTWEGMTFALLDHALDHQPATLTVRDATGHTATRNLDLVTIPGGIDQVNLLDAMGLNPQRPVLDAVLGEIVADSAAQHAGLHIGDRLLKADGVAIKDWEAWVNYVRARPGTPIQLEFSRDGAIQTVTLTPTAVPDKASKTGKVGRIGAAVKFPEMPEALRATQRYGVGVALVRATQKTWDMSVLTVRMLIKMVVGEISATNLSGPLTIAQYAGASANIGVVAFLSFIAVISVGLGVLNLLPVPVLDGGHLLFFLIEFVKGSPLSDQVQAFGQRIGMVLLGSLMVFAFYNDIARIFAA